MTSIWLDTYLGTSLFSTFYLTGGLPDKISVAHDMTMRDMRDLEALGYRLCLCRYVGSTEDGSVGDLTHGKK